MFRFYWDFTYFISIKEHFAYFLLTNSGVFNIWLTTFDAFARKVVGTLCFGKLVIMLNVGILLNLMNIKYKIDMIDKTFNAEVL